MITDAQDTVHRFGFAEEDRHTGVLDTADDGRGLMYIARAVAAERYGAQVVFLFHRVALAVETEGHDAAVAYHGFVAGRLLVEAVLGVERPGGNPHVFALLGEFVLELDMVEVLMVYIKARNLYRNVIAR